MEINSQKVFITDNATYDIRRYITAHFKASRHNHPEFELAYIEESYGKLYSGNVILDFKKGDLFLIAPGLLHAFKNPKNFEDGKTKAVATCVFFPRNFMGNGFLEHRETRMLNKLLKKAEAGIIHFENEAKIPKLLKKLLKTKGLTGIATLLEILDTLSASNRMKIYSDELAVNRHYFRQSKDERLNRVSDYLLANFGNKLTCGEVAGMVNMSVPSFCRFFRIWTEKTFIEVLNEIRVANAQKLLLETNKSISEIGKECGYSSMSHFNKKFRLVSNIAPAGFRKENR